MEKRLRDYVRGIRYGDVASVFGAVISLVALIQTDSLRNTAAVWLFGVYIFLLASFLVWREFVYSRKARYAEASMSLHRCAHVIRDAHGAIDRKSKDTADRKIRDALVAFAESFSLISGASCRACIKSITAITSSGVGHTEFHTETLARSGTAEKTTEDAPAPIKENTDFWVLFTENQCIYLCDDLTTENPYNNSNWPSNPEERKKFIKDRKFKYITTMVWPIRSSEASGLGNPEIIGFLCIDSLTRKIFERRYDVDLGAIVADSLYPLLLRYRNTQEFHPQSPPT